MGPSDFEPQVVDLHSFPAAVVVGHQVPVGELRGFFDTNYPRIAKVVAAEGLTPKSVFARYFSMPGETVDLEVGFEVSEPIESIDGIEQRSVSGGRAVQVTHVGPFEGLGDTWERLREWMAAEGWRPGHWVMEQYLTEPTPEADPSSMRTLLSWPVAED